MFISYPIDFSMTTHPFNILISAAFILCFPSTEEQKKYTYIWIVKEAALFEVGLVSEYSKFCFSEFFVILVL